ncbi:MAG TPA: ABC transporter substrate-binding protein, partial [Anaerolineaceae bacterium]|nr:ABC transporter substrate-binding protein [Anaerolineaceae bacterium]
PGDFISWDQPDSRWILGYEWLAMEINPETFQEYDFMGSVMDFYQDFYELDADTINENIIPLVYGSF